MDNICLCMIKIKKNTVCEFNTASLGDRHAYKSKRKVIGKSEGLKLFIQPCHLPSCTLKLPPASITGMAAAQKNLLGLEAERRRNTAHSNVVARGNQQ